ncbi:MAG: beta strand repeat-containing protein [Gemmataceae bacterium]
MTNAFRRFFKISQNKKARKSSLSSRLELLTLEERITPAIYTVTNNNDTGLGSLRRAISDSNVTTESDTIVFAVTGTITLSSALPTIDPIATAGTLTITGPGSNLLTISGNNGKFTIFTIANGGNFDVPAAGNLFISGVTVSGAKVVSSGGAFYNEGTLTISSSTISGNSSTFGGGGIFNRGNLTISNSTISGNSSIQVPDGFGWGGGILNNSTPGGNSGSLTVTNSTISGNSADQGGGIFNNTGNLVTISNSTISGNSATAATNGGGGIRNRGTLTLSNSTISSNAAPGYGGGISNGNGTLNIANTIIANSTGGISDFSGPGTVNLIAGATKANNLITLEPVLWATKVTSAQLNLGPLQNNGGSTTTMALGVGSVAIGTASPTISNAPPINGLDQRGFIRSSTAPSIGAYEANAVGAALNPTFGPTTSTADGFTVQITNYDAAFTFSGSATANGMVSISNTGFVTVTGVAPATSSTATITTTRTGYNSGSGMVTASSNPGLAALNPTFGATTSTIDGFTVQITNYDPLFTFSGTATANGIVSISNTGLVTVTGLASGTSSTATITTTRTGYNSGSGMVTASSNPGLAALDPTFGVTTSTLDGFTVQITNYNAAFTFSGTATANGVVSISNTGFVTVTGVAPGTSSTATIITNRIGYNSGSGAVTATSNVPPVPLNPTFGTPTSTPDGFTVQITNYDAAFTFGGTATAGGRVSINGTGLVTVNGVAPGTSSTATITTTRSGYGAGSGSITAFSANGAALTPTFGTPSPNANGFTV